MKTTSFIFDDVCISPELQIGAHSHELWELSYVICGAGTRTIGNLTETIQQGEIILVPPNMPHVWRFDPDKTDKDGNIANISVFFDPKWLMAVKHLFPEMREAIETIEVQREAVFYTGEAYRETLKILLDMRKSHPDRRAPKMLELMLAISNMSESRPAGTNNRLSRIEQRLEKVRVYCACNYSRNITLDEVSRYVGMNKSGFCTFMRRNANKTLSEYVNDVRLERAKEKLEHTEANIAEIAMECGFHNPTYFNRVFKAKYGHTPKMTRTASSGQPDNKL